MLALEGVLGWLSPQWGDTTIHLMRCSLFEHIA